FSFFFQAEDGIRDLTVTGVQTCALPIYGSALYGGTWRPDRRSLAKIRDAIAWRAEEWKKAKRGLQLEGDSLKRAPRGYAENHPRSEERRVGKSVDLGGRRIMKKKEAGKR